MASGDDPFCVATPYRRFSDLTLFPASPKVGKRFANLVATSHAGASSLVKWGLTRKPGAWDRWLDAPPGPPPPPAVAGHRLRITHINHATWLIQGHGVNILTDPIWSDRCSPLSTVGPKRHRPPGIRFEDLPRIDGILLSHNHYDHLDMPTLRTLAQTFQPWVITGLGNGPIVKSAGITRVIELDWWQSIQIQDEVEVTAVPAQHFSGRSLWDRDHTLWVGLMLSLPQSVTFFAGDTGYGHHFEQIARGFPKIDLSLLPIGAFRPEWFMSRVHMSPDEAIRAHAALGSHTSVGIHYGTFRLADDGQTEGPDRIAALLAAHPDPKPRFWTLEFGEGRDVPL